jgi:GT2 family glycosyltransferase
MAEDYLIVVLSVNKPKLTTDCLTSILDAGYSPESVRLVDNGSNDYSRELVKKKHPGIVGYRLDENRGYSGGFNFGLKSAFEEGARSVVFLTNDTELTAGAAESLLSSAEQSGAGIITPKIVLKNHPDVVDSIGGFFDRSNGVLSHQKRYQAPLLGEDTYAPGTAMWISREAFEKTGGTDEGFHTYWEDVDLSFRARKQGIPIAVCDKAVIRHGVGQTCHKKPLYTTFYFNRNRIRFCKRHLSMDEWQALRPHIFNELKVLQAKWEEAKDERRLEYAGSLFEELAT